MTIINFSQSSTELHLMTDAFSYRVSDTADVGEAWCHGTKFKVLQHINSVCCTAGSVFTASRFFKWLDFAPLKSIDEVENYGPEALAQIVELKDGYLNNDGNLVTGQEAVVLAGYSHATNKPRVWVWLAGTNEFGAKEIQHGWSNATLMYFPYLQTPPNPKGKQPFDILVQAAEKQRLEYDDSLGAELHHIKVTKKGIACTVAKRLPNFAQAQKEVDENREQLFAFALAEATSY